MIRRLFDDQSHKSNHVFRSVSIQIERQQITASVLTRDGNTDDNGRLENVYLA